MPPDSRPAVHPTLAVLRRRADFLGVAAAGRKWVTTGFVIQAAGWPLPGAQQSVPRPPASPSPELRFGLTASKKTGNAVIRNRARRRLRALAHEVLPRHAQPGHAFVLIARAETTVTRDYNELKKDLRWALKRLGLRSDE